MSDKTRWIVRAAMTEYMILMAGALILYGAQQIWPRETEILALGGGIVIAVACVVNFLYILRSATAAANPPSEHKR